MVKRGWVEVTPHTFCLALGLFQVIGHQFSSVQLLSCVQLFATPWIAARQASLSITNSRSSLRLMCIELVMPSSHLILCRPLLLLPQSLPASGSFPVSQLFARGGQSIGVSASASVLPVNTQDWSPLGWTGWISLRVIYIIYKHDIPPYYSTSKYFRIFCFKINFHHVILGNRKSLLQFCNLDFWNFLSPLGMYFMLVS